MSDHVYKQIELTGSSTQGIDHAVQTAISKASKSLHHMDWFEVTDIRGQIQDNQVAHWQVSMKVGFRLD